MFEKNEPTQIVSQKETMDSKNIESLEKTVSATMSRRGFLKMAAIFGAGVVIGQKADEIKKIITSDEPIIENEYVKEMEDDFWLSVIEDVSRQVGEELTPQDIRAHLITKLFNIPQGWTSGLSTQKEVNADGTIEQKRLYPKLDQLIAIYFTNKSVVVAERDDGEPVISTDFRDFYNIDNALKEFKEKVEQLGMEEGKEIGMRIYNILNKEYKYLQDISIQNKNVSQIDDNTLDNSIEFVYLPGGMPLILRGYIHSEDWEEVHGKHLADTYKDADYIAIESFANLPMGESFNIRWANPQGQQGDYDQLMKELIEEGFEGFFLEIDARNESKIRFDSYSDTNDKSQQIELPDIFYENYFLYLQRENPRFTEKIGTVLKLKQLMLSQTTTAADVLFEDAEMVNNSKVYDASLSVSDELVTTTLPTGNELGQMAFVDAISALKLHILAQNMNDGHIKKGIVVDFEGAEHISMKSFYLKYPQYAAEVVLRVIYELMAGYVGNHLLSDFEIAQGINNPQNMQGALKMLNKPNWFDAIHEIGRIPMAYVEDEPNKTVELGSNQKQIKAYNKLNTGLIKDLDTNIIWSLFDDAYIQKHIDKNFNKNN